MAKHGFNIYIPYHGQYTALRECIGSIFLQTRHIPFRITVIDDGSSNKEFFSTISQMDSQIDGIRLEQQKGFGAALNEAIKSTEEPWLVFLNSDCVIREMDWLSELYRSLENNMKDKVGLVSATMNNGGSCSIIERTRTTERKESFILAQEPMPLICSIAPRKLFDRIGLFKEYPYGYFEDEEFYWRMKKKGYKQGYCEKSWIEHKGGLTTQSLWASNPHVKTIMTKENRIKCINDVKKILNN